MTMLNDPRRSRTLALGLLVAAVALVLGLVAAPVVWLHQRYDAAIERYGSRHAREIGISQTRATWESAIETTRQANPARFYLKANSPTLAGSELQERIQKAFEAAGGRIASVQVLPPKEEGELRRISVQVSGNANIAAIQKLLVSLEGGEPMIFVDTLNVRAGQGRNYRPQPGVEPEFGLQLTVYAYLWVAGS